MAKLEWYWIVIPLIVIAGFLYLTPKLGQYMYLTATKANCDSKLAADKVTYAADGSFPAACVQLTSTMVSCDTACGGKYSTWVESGDVGQWSFVAIQRMTAETNPYCGYSAADKTSFKCYFQCVHSQSFDDAKCGSTTCTVTRDVLGGYINQWIANSITRDALGNYIQQWVSC
jgi:hypothetical protein